MATIKIKLNEALERIQITPNRFSVESRIRSNTIYDLINNKNDRITFNTLVSILETLNKIAKEKDIQYNFTPNDILEYIEEI
ncbi:helix-turn-helix domain-containing protein [Peribacillus aracenensis]|uniref:helix-turn-helix domain-containing protein n=1 Tax=Peribacillus aracenensis TaxID=2976708 RepID=UPI0021A81DE3|nr:helix-turn-helix transcriptional regulator [Peribacillus sp. BBB004]